MRRICHALGSLVSVSLALVGCAPLGNDGGWVQDAPPETEPPQPPDSLPPTGQVWEEVVVDGECGHQTISWVLVDEMCGATDAQDYLARFRTPMFRDGVAIGADLFAVDGTNLWVLDISSADSIPRKALSAGFGTPISIGAHGTDLVIAAGGEGLLVVDVTDPAAPVRTATIELEGPALDVHVDGDRALVAIGAAGMAVVDLLADPPAVVQTVPIEGFTAGVTVKGETAYVAACDSLQIVDLTTGQVLGKGWLDPEWAYEGDFLVAPAKDVEIMDGMAYVAAGRFGAVAVDVTDPTNPTPYGNCTIHDDLKFYASGVRAQEGMVFVAGGEWGVLSVDAAAMGCELLSHPTLPDYPVPGGGDGDMECHNVPPWEVVPWQELWAPPAAGKDPIQVLPMGGVVYAFGDARRNALRAIDLKDASDVSAPNVGRYEEPRLVTGIAANGNTVAVLGKAGGIFVRDEASLLVPMLDVPPLPADAVAVAVLADGRWVAGTAQSQVLVQGEPALDVPGPIWPFGLVTSGNTVAVAAPAGVLVHDLDTKQTSSLPSGVAAMLPPSLFQRDDGFVMAAPEWTSALLVNGADKPAALSEHGVFDEADIQKTALWRRGVPARILLGGASGLIEVATLGGKAGLFVHATSGRVDLPSGEYRGGAAVGDRAYLITADRSAYRSKLVTVDIGAETPAVLAVESFLGVGTGVALDGDRLYVADGDRGVRVYARTADSTTLLGIVAAQEVAP